MSGEESSILMLGGYGSVGRETAITIRRLNPRTPLIIAGRDAARAQSLAAELGNAVGITCDLAAPDLKLPPELDYRAVVVFAKDEQFHALDQAIHKRAAYVAISDYAVEIAPLVARAGADGKHIPILLLGHHLGGLVTVATQHFTRSLTDITDVKIGAVFDASDLGGATAQEDATRLARATPHPLVRSQGRWLWAEGTARERQFIGTDGGLRDGTAISLLDVTSVAAVTKAQSVRFDIAVRNSSPRARHEVIIEITRRKESEGLRARRIVIESDGFHTAATGRTVAIVLKQFLGLDLRSGAFPGLWLPENVLDAAEIVSQARELGISINWTDSEELVDAAEGPP